ncbi:MAG: hypothetical protein HRU30_20315 [Rhodobacteraceae bacterium]|nr:hypothetical protein [Paracoccaceae bacterium]
MRPIRVLTILGLIVLLPTQSPAEQVKPATQTECQSCNARHAALKKLQDKRRTAPTEPKAQIMPTVDVSED